MLSVTWYKNKFNKIFSIFKRKKYWTGFIIDANCAIIKIHLVEIRTLLHFSKSTEIVENRILEGVFVCDRFPIFTNYGDVILVELSKTNGQIVSRVEITLLDYAPNSCYTYKFIGRQPFNITKKSVITIN